MQKQTISRWKRDALEAQWDHRGQEDEKSKLIRQLANRVTVMADEVMSQRILKGDEDA